MLKDGHGKPRGKRFHIPIPLPEEITVAPLEVMGTDAFSMLL